MTIMALRKEDILKGVNDPELILIETLGGELPLRPLSKAEWSQIEKMEARGYGTFEANETAQRGRRKLKGGKVETKGKINLEKQAEADFKGKLEALHLSMNNSHHECDQWSKKEIESLKSSTFDEIYNKVRELSGVTVEKEEIDEFPED